MHRRDVLRLLSFSTLAGAAGRLEATAFPRPAAFAYQNPPGAEFVPDVDLVLTAAPDEVPLLPGAPTRVWRFTGRLLTGPADTLETLPGSCPARPCQVRQPARRRLAFPALALAMEPAEADVMHRPPRSPDEAILSKPFLLRVLLYGALITASTIGAFGWALANAPDKATTMAFMTLALAQIAHLGNARRASPVLGLRSAAANPYALGAVALSIGLQVAALYVDPLPRLLRVMPLATGEWLVVLCMAAVPALVGQAARVWRPQL